MCQIIKGRFLIKLQVVTHFLMGLDHTLREPRIFKGIVSHITAQMPLFVDRQYHGDRISDDLKRKCAMVDSASRRCRSWPWRNV
ncbi:MAG: hypothetical protein B6I22_12265 [Desulfobacteraceae bacterium 4572_123]|nr:MAG: hypothetical protein B6I22_12265 [Desulfobacteraceae bacterium 4572_123]